MKKAFTYRERSAHITLAVNLITKLHDENSKDFVFCCFFKAQPFCLLCCHVVRVHCLYTHSQTYPSRLLIWEDAALAACCEVAVNLEGVPRAALVWINPVLTWTDKGTEKTRKHTHTQKHTHAHTHTDGRGRERESTEYII